MTRPVSPMASEARALLRRYPDLESTELDRLLEIFPRLPILETALMTAEEDLRAKLHAFQRGHRRQVGGPAWQGLVLLAIPALMAAAFLWAIWQTIAG